MSTSGSEPVVPFTPEALSVQAQTSMQAGGVARGNFSVDSGTVIATLADLKKIDPKLYDQTMKSIAQGILKQMREHERRMKKIIRDGQIR